MGNLSDELIAKIADGSGRCYSHEGKAMAAEIREWRRRAAEAAKAAALTPAGPPPTTGSAPINWPSGTP